jgi:magnesium-transporting ATPase (P-type)
MTSSGAHTVSSRKVVFLLISTGAAEVVIFLLALLSNMPLPLLAVQLLWLNLVTNGIQDVALAFDPAEGDEMRHPPRAPREPIFNRIMIERVLLSATFMGIVAFLGYRWMLGQGYSVEEARSGTLMLMVLFENVHVFNSRSETLSVLVQNPIRNPLLLFGTVGAQLVHIAAIYTPGLNDVLALHPVNLAQWLKLLSVAGVLLVVMELHKRLRRRR